MSMFMDEINGHVIRHLTVTARSHVVTLAAAAVLQEGCVCVCVCVIAVEISAEDTAVCIYM